MSDDDGLVKTGERHFKAQRIVPVPWLNEDRKNQAAKHRRERTNISMMGLSEAVLISVSVIHSPVGTSIANYEKSMYGRWVNRREFVIG